MISPYQLHPLRSITTIFAAWKSFILAIALASSFCHDYDTSTSVFLDRLYGVDASPPLLVTRLTRWDAFYFVHAARDGYVYEQEWAFGTGVSISIRYICKIIRATGLSFDAGLEPLVGIAIAHLSHLVAALALYKLTIVVSNNKKLAFISSILCVISPGGIFLSSPYGESPCSALTFLGVYLFALNYDRANNLFQRIAALVLSGVCFGGATLMRSNGLSYGLLFAIEVVRRGLSFLSQPNANDLFTLAGAILGGLLLSAGTVVPQTMAWLTFCNVNIEDSRPWCLSTIPSIYSYVQAEYWNVGFLKYWTPNQIPLFLLATPMLTVMITSGLRFAQYPSRGFKPVALSKDRDMQIFVRGLAASQAMVAMLAITNYHVQIISRLSSGYLVWYWWIASSLMDKKYTNNARSFVMFMMIYAGIQGGLFSLFLPPA